MVDKEYLERVLKAKLDCFMEFKATTNEAFEAIHAAEQWAKENGYAVGSMCMNEPIGIAKNTDYIAKWRNLGKDDMPLLNGAILCDQFGMREARTIVVYYKKETIGSTVIDLMPYIKNRDDDEQ